MANENGFEGDSNQNKDNTDSLLADIQKKITDAFDIFDHESNKTVDVREVGTIIRSLNCCPSEAELHDMLAEIEEEEPTGYIRFEKFLPMMTKVLMERRYKPSPEDQILKAFQVLDTDMKGYLTVEELTKYMTEEGEPFAQEEMEEMISAAVDPEKKTVLYKDYASVMAVEETWGGSKFIILQYIQGEKFSKDEMEEMLSHAVDKVKGTILYKEYTGVMAVDEYAL